MMRTLIDLLRLRSSDAQSSHGYRVLASGDAVTASINYADLIASSSVIARRLQSLGVKKGDPVLLPLPMGTEFLAALFGTIMVGSLAVPLPPANGRRAERRLHAVIGDLGRGTVLCRSTDIPKLKELAGDSEGIRVLGTEECCEQASAGLDVEVDEDDACIIQYTSGSTGAPRGVVLTHRNIMEQQRILADRFGHDRDSRILTWLPPFHDMGLIGGVLQPLYIDAECFFMPTTLFLQQPARWPAAISRYRCGTSGAPDFAYAMCAEKTTEVERSSLDLSCWTVAFNGADHVRAGTLDRFVEVFGPYGFQRRAFFPCYGLAEACLMVSGGGNGHGDPASIIIDRVTAADAGMAGSERLLIGCGKPIPGHYVEIVSPVSGSIVAGGKIGEIWISGPTVASGYWNNPLRTAAVFGARLPGTQQLFLRTGDLGFLSNGELFVLGRIDDLIVFRGENFNPEDIESVASACSDVADLAGAAFLDEDGIVLVQEIRKRSGQDLLGIAASLRAAVWEALELNPARIVLTRNGTLPKTTSGKIQRRMTRRLLRDEKLPVLHCDRIVRATPNMSSFPDLDSPVWRLVAQFVPANAITLDSRLLDLGFDSLSLMGLQISLAQTLGVEVPTDWLYTNPRISELAERPSETNLEGAPSTDTQSTIPLTSSQRIIAYSEELFPGDPFYHVGVMLRLGACRERETIARALNSLVQRHEPLRAALVHDPDGLAFRIGPAVPVELDCVFVDSIVAGEIVRLLANFAARPFDLSAGRNYRFLLIQAGSGETALVIVIHHIVCDGWAMRVFLRDLHALLSPESSRSLPALPAYRDVAAAACRAEVAAEENEKHRQYWTSAFADAPATLRLPTDRQRPRLETRAGARVSGNLGASQYAAVQRAGQGIGATPFMMFAAILAVLIHRWTGSQDFVIGTAVANRRFENQLDVMGCFINFVPVRIRISGQEILGEVLRNVRDAIRDALAYQNYPYDRLIKYLNPSRRADAKPLFSVGLWYHTYPGQLTPIELGGFQPKALLSETSDLDLRVVVTPLADGSLDFSVEYKTSLFEDTSISCLLNLLLQWAEGIQDLMGRPIADLYGRIGWQVAAPPATATKADEIVIAANFAAQDLDRYVAFWFSSFARPTRITHAPFNDIRRALIDPNSAVHNNANGFNLILLDLAAWHLDRTEDQTRRLASETAHALLELGVSSATTIVVVFPAADCPFVSNADETCTLLADVVSKVPGMSFLRLDDVRDLYNVAQIRTPGVPEVEIAPYSREFIAAAGTRLARACLSHRQPRSKAIIVDCDGTLWDGICGEDGPENIAITPDHAALQEFLIEKQRQGLLICLCSRNNESDIMALFDSGVLGPLTLEHVATSRINWSPKAENILSIAEELKLDPASFVFVDNDLFECEQVRVRLPVIATIHASDPAEALARLKHLWTLDAIAITEDDWLRTSRLKQDRRRNQARIDATDVDVYVESLGVSVDTRPLDGEDLDRVSQLSRRTTQFTTSARAWSAAALAGLLGDPARDCFTVRVSDRFGSYGLVGAMIVSHHAGRMIVDSFFLSCRTLGRGVEKKMALFLVRLALRHGHPWIDIVLTRTNRNVPARSFFVGLTDGGERDVAGTSTVVGVSPAALEERCMRKSSFAKAAKLSAQDFDEDESPDPEAGSQPQWSLLNQRWFERIATHFQTAQEVVTSLDAQREPRGLRPKAFVAPATDTERVIAAIWSKSLNVDRVGTEDNFFDLGGHSMQMIYILKEVNDTFGLDCSLTEFIESLTVAEVATLVDAKRGYAALVGLAQP
ncbi:HAD-IIIC family phosphatase [Methylocystis sp.]|uniref:HAD-IIIC family phosphatase n=1 Tax=Methylocystis sp. TaxID=1911079 RepID=UPI003DA38EF3